MSPLSARGSMSVKLPLQAIFSHLYPDPNASLSAEDPAPPETVDAAEVKGPEAEADPAGDAEAADEPEVCSAPSAAPGPDKWEQRIVDQ